jgi:phosphohistidine phosphatase SixA
MAMRARLGITLLIAVPLLVADVATRAEDRQGVDGESVWAAARQREAVLLMRHATAPGIGDPPDFRLDDCATQRNLSEAGRAEARAIGATLRANGITAASVWSSAWCRCLETAALLELGPVQRLPQLNSFFTRGDEAAAQTAALRAWIADQPAETGPLVLVSHQVNITALTGLNTRPGETVVALRAPDRALKVIGILPAPAP